MNKFIILGNTKRLEVLSKLLELGYEKLTDTDFNDGILASSKELYYHQDILFVGDSRKILAVDESKYIELMEYHASFTIFNEDDFLNKPLTISADDLRHMVFQTLTKDQLLQIDKTIADIFTKILKDKNKFTLEYGNNQIQTFDKIMLKKVEYNLKDLGYNVKYYVNYNVQYFEISW
jgi:hypothetical protein